VAVTGGPVLRAALGAVARRRVQTVVVFCVLGVAAAAGLLGLTLATSGTEFASAFAASHGAHLAVTIDAAKVTGAQLAATRHLPGVTQAAGPYPQTTLTLTPGRVTGPPAGRIRPPGGGPQYVGSSPGPPAGRSSGPPAGRIRPPGGGVSSPGQYPVGQPPGSSGAGGPPPVGGAAGGLTVVGRASRSGPLDDITVTRGHWLTGPGQIVVAVAASAQIRLGGQVTVTSAPGQPQLTVVGLAWSVAHDEDAWVVPGELAALRPRGAPAQVQMLYTFAHAATAGKVSADLAALKAALPAGAVTASVSWLEMANSNGAQVKGIAQRINTPFVVAFAVIGLALAALITASVASAAVVAGYRRIGVLKSIGFTPAQVTATYLAQTGAPALAGAIAGTILGNWWVVPMLNRGDFAGIDFVSTRYVPLWINLTVPLGMCVLAGLAALVPALRAGRLSAVAAIAAGQAPRAGHGYAAHRLAARLPLPRPVTVGLAAAFARPGRSAITLGAVTSGLTAVVLAVGLGSSIAKINGAAGQWHHKEVVGPWFGRPAFTPAQQRKVVAALRAQPGTGRYVAEATGQARVPGVGPHVPITAFDGDAGGLGWDITGGTWYHRPGEVVVNTADPATAGLAVGQTIHMIFHGKPVTARVTGEVYTPGLPGALLASWQSLGGNTAGLAVSQYLVELRPGISQQHYEVALTRALGPSFGVASIGLGPPGTVGSFGQVDTSLIRRLTILVAVLAGLGVLNTVLMLTRERVHDLGVFKAVGMTPRQTIAMVICWAAAPALAAAVIALPAGMALQDAVMHAIGRAHPTFVTFATTPGSLMHVYTPGGLALLALAGVAIAAAGALGPATWAAAAKTTTALRAE
jgi:putative ABC transport system permease protein